MLGPGRWLMLAGAVLVLAGTLVRRWAARRDLDAAAADTDARQVFRRTAPANTEPGTTVRAGIARSLASDPPRTAHTAATALVAIGLALVGVGFLWR
jgi:hypothetical protein